MASDKPEEDNQKKQSELNNALNQRLRENESLQEILKSKDPDEAKKLLNQGNVILVIEDMFPGMGRLLEKMFKAIAHVGDKKDAKATPEGEPQTEGPQANISENAQQSLGEVFESIKDSGMSPGDASAAVSAKIIELERDGVLSYPSEGAQYEFRNQMGNLVYTALETHGPDSASNSASVSAFAVGALEIAEQYKVDINFGDDGPKVGVEPGVYGYNEPIEVSQTQLLDMAVVATEEHPEVNTTGWVDDYKMGKDGHLVEQGNVRLAEVLENLGEDPTIEMMTQDDERTPFVKMTGQNGEVFFSNRDSFPGLSEGQGVDLTKQMDQEPKAPALTTEPPAPGAAPQALSMSARV